MMLILFTCQERPSVEARRDIVLPVELLSVLIVILDKYLLCSFKKSFDTIVKLTFDCSEAIVNSIFET